MLGQRLVDRSGHQLLRHVLLHVVAEVALDQPAWHVPLPVALQLHRAGNGGVGGIQRVFDAVRRELHRDLLHDGAQVFHAALHHYRIRPFTSLGTR